MLTIAYLNPDTLAPANGFAHVSVAAGSRFVYMTAQPAEDAEGNAVGEGDLAAQTEQAMANVVTALKAAGATYDDVVKVTYYVVNWDESMRPALAQGLAAAAKRFGINPVKPSALVGVTGLSDPRFLVDVDVIAVLD